MIKMRLFQFAIKKCILCGRLEGRYSYDFILMNLSKGGSDRHRFG